MTDFPECEHLTNERLKRICRKEAGYSEEQTAAYDRSMGIVRPGQNSGTQSIATRISPNPPAPIGVGTHLERIFAKWSDWIELAPDDQATTDEMNDIAAAGKASCLGCQGLAAQMNGWKPDECERRLDEIVDRITANAGHFRVKLTGQTVGSIPFFKTIIRNRFVLRAISLARESAKGNE